MGAEGIARDEADGSMAEDAQFIEKIFGSNSVDYTTLIQEWKGWHFNQQVLRRVGEMMY